ncbi:MAG: hypothetical protein WC523_04455 [Patescibacteria group bacterium]
MTWKENLKCLFGFHPRNPARWISEEAYYVTTCHNGDTDWYEKCPRCKAWHYSSALNKEERNYIRPDIIHLAPRTWRDGFENWACGSKKLSGDVGTQVDIRISCPDCIDILKGKAV